MVDICGYRAVPTVYGMNSSFIGVVSEGRQTLAHGRYVRRTLAVVNGSRRSATEAARVAWLSVLDKATMKWSAREEGGLLI